MPLSGPFQAHICPRAKRLLANTGLAARALDLEIAESLLMQPSDDNLAHASVP